MCVCVCVRACVCLCVSILTRKYFQQSGCISRTTVREEIRTGGWSIVRAGFLEAVELTEKGEHPVWSVYGLALCTGDQSVRADHMYGHCAGGLFILAGSSCGGVSGGKAGRRPIEQTINQKMSVIVV